MVIEIGNGWIHRRAHIISGRIGTTSLLNNISGEEYIDQTNSEFEIEISGEGQKVVLDFRDFELKSCDTPNWSDDVRTIEVKLESNLNGEPFPVSVFYEARAQQNFIKKWLRVGPCPLEGWVIRNVTIENMKFKEMVEGITPQTRYLRMHGSFEDRVHTEPDKVNTAEPHRRFTFGDLSRTVVTYWGYGEGLYFFTESLLGEELFNRPSGLVMKQRDFVPLSEGLTTGPAVIESVRRNP